jgi:hypothetical protein
MRDISNTASEQRRVVEEKRMAVAKNASLLRILNGEVCPSPSRRTHHLSLATCTLFFLAPLLPGCFLPAAFAQTETATISGRVSDSSGAVVPGAVLHVVNIDKGTETDTKTNGSGIYVVPGVPAGRYRIQVEHDGFKVANLTGLTVNVQDNLEENFKLEVGSASESVTVNGSGLNINTTDGSVSTVIDRQFVENLPLNGRSFQDLIDLTPGVVTQSPQAGGGAGAYGVPDQGDFSVNGQRTESNNYLVDGISANTSPGSPGPNPGISGSLGASTALGTTQSLLSVDALQEFRVESSTYSAEYGGAPGGQFSFLSRSGTNSFHGSLFEYLRNDYFDANDWFNDYLSVSKPALRQSDFGGTLGGPVQIPRLYNGGDKTFFFFSYEGLRLVESTEASQQYVPSDSLRSSAATLLQPIVNAYPLPTGPEIQEACDNVNYQCVGQPLGTAVPSGMAPFVKAYSLPSRIDSTSLRLDQAVGHRAHIFLRAAYTPSDTTTRALSTLTTDLGNSQSYTGGGDIQVSSIFSDQVRVGYSRAISAYDYTLDNFGGATPTNLAQDLGTCCSSTSSNYLILHFENFPQSSLVTWNNSGYGRQWNLTDTADWELGRHSIKAGVSYRRIASPYTVADPNAEPIYWSPTSVQANNADALVVERQDAPAPLFNQFALFVQDEWKVASSVTLSLGLRWDVQPSPTSTNSVKPYSLAGNPNDPSTYALGNAGAPLYKTTWGNFAPRVGVAWKAHGKSGAETVVRGGVGVFYDTGLQGTGALFTTVGTQALAIDFGVPIPLTPALLDLPLVGVPPYNNVGFMANNFQLPYTVEWNAAIEQALGREQRLTLAYVGSNGRRLVEDTYLSGGTLNPGFGQIYVFQNGLTSNYQALQAQFQRQIGHGITALASYTWSHSLDYGSTGSDYGYSYVRGNSDFDLRDNFNAALTWDLPLHHDNALSKTLLNGWGLDGRVFARSGFPVSLQGDFYVNPVTGVASYTGLNTVPGVPIYVYSSGLPGGRGINPNAFAAVPSGSVGDAPRNFIRGFDDAQVNVAVRRELPLYESLRLQFRAEAFNVLNHPNFGYIDPQLGDATFGQAIHTLAQSLSSVSALYQQGGARSMQFALKLIF